MEFVKWPKIARLHQVWEFSEKVDGTNGVLWWKGDVDGVDTSKIVARVVVDEGPLYLLAGSRTRWLTTQDDNFGFAGWAAEHAKDLAALGPGRHFGEWFGHGIQRGYGMDHREFALFDQRWTADEVKLPGGVCVVPVLATVEGWMLNEAVSIALEVLKETGSVVAPGFARPEGLVVRHLVNGTRFKVLLEGDNQPKGIAHADSQS